MTDGAEDPESSNSVEPENERPGPSNELRTDGGEVTATNPTSSSTAGNVPQRPAQPEGPTNQVSSRGIDPEELSTEDLLGEVLNERENRLEPISPPQALDLYLDDKARECSKATINAHRSRLGFFVDWCGERGITNLNDLSARNLHDFRAWRRQDINVVTERTQMVTLRVFIKWCETIDTVEAGLSEKITIPSLGRLLFGIHSQICFVWIWGMNRFTNI